jgi:hypothetical protein
MTCKKPGGPSRGSVGEISELRNFSRGHNVAAAAILASALGAALPASLFAEPIANQLVEKATPHAFDIFLNQLMASESGGRKNAKNPRSSALGPFQFIESTFLDVARRHFAAEIAGLKEAQILNLRTDPDLSRRAAFAYCRETVDYLREQGLDPTFAQLRLAYLLGPADAARILRAARQTPVAQLLSPAVIRANPFLRRMSVSDLLAKSERDLSARG